MPDTTFATSAELATRMGRALTAAEGDQADLLLPIATSLIVDAVDKDAAWATALDPVPAALRVITMEAVVRVLANPLGLRSEQESLGAHSHSASYRDVAAVGLELTEAEGRLARQAVYGTSTGSSKPDTFLPDIYPELVEEA